MTTSANLIQQGKLAEAEAGYRQALARNPGDAEALTNLGVVLQLQGRLDEAEDGYRRALALQPALAVAHNNLGVVLQALDRLDEAILSFRRAAALRPNYQDALNGLGVALQAQGRIGEALACFRQVLELRPDHAETRVNLATALLLAGDFEAGFGELEWRWQAHGRVERLPEGFPPHWLGEPLAGRTLLVLSEQGAGDTFQFIRYLKPLKEAAGAGAVVLLAPRSMTRLLTSAEGIDVLVSPEEPLPGFDCYIRLLSLPQRLGAGAGILSGTAPYLHAAGPLIDARRRQLAGLPGLTAGLVWRGNPLHRNDRKRSLPETLWPRLGRTPGVSWVSLQPGPSARESELLAEIGAADISPTLGDWAETAAVLAALDLIVTVDTGVAHLAGALGTPAWVLLPHAPDWRWQLGRDDSPWYPSLRLFRQPRPGDWASVLERISAGLTELAAGRPEPSR